MTGHTQRSPHLHWPRPHGRPESRSGGRPRHTRTQAGCRKGLMLTRLDDNTDIAAPLAELDGSDTDGAD